MKCELINGCCLKLLRFLVICSPYCHGDTWLKLKWLERPSLILENLNEDPWGSPAIRAATYLCGFTYLFHVQILITFLNFFLNHLRSWQQKQLILILWRNKINEEYWAGEEVVFTCYSPDPLCIHLSFQSNAGSKKIQIAEMCDLSSRL